MPKRRIIRISENVINVDFTSQVSPEPSSTLNIPRQLIIDVSPQNYSILSEEEERTGMNKSTIVNRAVGLYGQIYEKQRKGFSIAFIDQAIATAQIFKYDDPGRDSAEVIPFNDPTDR